jgi:hypothetical protein
MRVLRRQSIRPIARLCIRLKRPSVLDLRLTGDPWIIPHGDEHAALCFGDWELTSVRGSRFDLSTLNQLLSSLRHRRPRRRC